MPTYRARDKAILRAAFDAGIKPTGNAIADACGLPATTINKMRGGRAPNATTMAALVKRLHQPHETLFELIDDDSSTAVVSA